MSFLEDTPLTSHADRLLAEENLLEALSDVSISGLRFLTDAGPVIAQAHDEMMKHSMSKAIDELMDKIKLMDKIEV